MKRILWWTLFGISGAGLPALWLGQSVLGQPESRQTAAFPPKGVVAAPPSGGGAKKGEEPRTLELMGGQYLDLQAPQGFPPVKPGLPAPIAPPLPPTPSEPQLPVAPPTPFGLKPEPSAPLFAPTRPETPGATPLEAAPGRQSPSLSLEWIAPPAIRINQPMPCQILVKNTSSAPLHNVVVRHRVGQGVVCKSSEPKISQEAGDLVWNLGTVPGEQTRRIDLVLVSQARGTLNCQATATFTTVAGHHVQVREPLLAIKMRTADKAIAGETVNFLVTLTNPGDGVAESVKVKALLPDGLDHSSGRRTIEFDVGNLAPKETRSMQLPCIAKGNGVHKCMIVATADGNLSANDSAQVDILVPKLDVALAGPKLRYLDRRAVYVLKITNPGSAPANNVEVQEQIPSGFKFQQANFGGQYQEATRLVTWNLGDLQPGQSKEIAVDLIPIEIGNHRLSAFVKTARGLKTEVEMRTVVEGLPSLFIEVAHVDDPIEVGAETAYEIRVANTGTKTESNIEVVCTLPEQLEFKGAKCTTTLRFRQEGRDLIFEPLPKLAPKADVIYRVQVRGLAPGDIRFRTKIRADGLKDPLIREESTRVYSDDGPPRTTPSPISTPDVPTPSPVTPGPAPVAPPTSDPIPVPLPMSPSIPAPTPAPTVPPIGVPSTTPGPLPFPGPSVPMVPPIEP